MDSQGISRRSFIKKTTVLTVAAANLTLLSGLAKADDIVYLYGPDDELNKCPPPTVHWTGGDKKDGDTAQCTKNGKDCCIATWNANGAGLGGHWVAGSH